MAEKSNNLTKIGKHRHKFTEYDTVVRCETCGLSKAEVRLGDEKKSLEESYRYLQNKCEDQRVEIERLATRSRERKFRIGELEAEIEWLRRFPEHIQAHLKPGQVVICKICGKTYDEIVGVKP